MLLLHHSDRLHIAFDDHRFVAIAGLILPVTTGVLAVDIFWRGLLMDRPDHRRHPRLGPARDLGEQVRHEVGAAALPRGPSEDGGDGVLQALVRIGGHQLHPIQAPGVGDFVRYIAEAHHLQLYLTPSPLDLPEGTRVGGLTETERDTLDTVIMLGGHVTASTLAATEGMEPSAAANRLANLEQRRLPLRQPRGRREGDGYMEPRSATSTPMVFGWRMR